MRGTVEMTSPEFIDKDGNVPAPIAARLELARELYELSLKNSKEDCILRTATCLTISSSSFHSWPFNLQDQTMAKKLINGSLMLKVLL